MNKVKITVLKTTFDKELADEYGVEGISSCPMLREGQVFYADYAKPEGFCDEAWKAIYQYVFALSHGVKNLFYFGDWIKEKGVAICSCNDGLRPVIFKLEATDAVSEIDYVPVR
ncbi:MAG: TIGR04076 family protein [Bacillota bacterium]|nr:MAG: TIGR04076 family protein [Bacillota bacterium]